MSSYPDPDNLFAVTYSGWLVWAQWTIGNTTINLINAWWGVKMNKKPTDPLVPSKEYSYSKLAYGNGYQLKSDWEGDSLLLETLSSFLRLKRPQVYQHLLMSKGTIMNCSKDSDRKHCIYNCRAKYQGYRNSWMNTENWIQYSFWFPHYLWWFQFDRGNL